ncbi:MULTISPECIES: methylated-DNA--[protein]-cysteine S-methyltransferase [unclassified Rhodococcus (in: high G+C Gram-positive bacteria)]|jgi:methylated-DNA-[protein]-cysteine S-methyltransferase|uniref:methylated-DNA--[protein]-cysteine S-methyltransferase n=1 Tax=unclassified Rhodococcus (in: high G+C Gram-positive bacteria) TaxID=192944 RepID=UPI00146C4923|nr:MULTISPECIES: methylated-DNA--[protein]-cysteine S-methyltransferase [unclassified Rhodococcus (in: high G+C Gram-positive bacteria)]MBF0660177.1 methylated-DNA--[protein]-cysteine S-methyltransferase [Rhodococcus sp. (in: high G+C Gram-positive bacteria)]NMD97547.1 methylated-DNA--[protein]-cysteine S-methyltransferase [Rhodococcus sp. BL-253-APC-6A1W]
MNFPIPSVSTSDLAWLHDKLVLDAEAAGLLDVAYRVVDTPVGPLLLASTTVGLVKVAFVAEGEDAVLDELARQIGPRILDAPARFDDAVRQLDEYFGGTRTAFDLPLDFRLATGFRREVISRLADIEYGRTASYADVAASAGSPRAVRAVGTACAKNPLPVVLPCHRVVRTDGGLGQYAGGVEAKQILLRLEAAA